MRVTRLEGARVEELLAMLAAYHVVFQEIEETGCADVSVEIEHELWELEQELYDPRRRRATRGA